MNLKLKFTLLIAIFVGLCTTLTRADEDYPKTNMEILQTLKKNIQNQIPFYQKMATCTPYEYTEKHNTGASMKEVSYIYKVHGPKDNICHVQIASEHCYYPQEVNKKYAEDMLAVFKRKLDKINKEKSFYYSTNDSENAYFNKMQKKYCKIEWEK